MMYYVVHCEKSVLTSYGSNALSDVGKHLMPNSLCSSKSLKLTVINVPRA